MTSTQRLADAAWLAPCRTQTDKLVLLALAHDAGDRARVRIDPIVLATKTSLPMRQVEGSLASLHRAGLIDARRWDDSGCWSARLTFGGVR